MIFGGGKSQMPFIMRANALGLRTIVVDAKPDAPGGRVAEIINMLKLKIAGGRGAKSVSSGTSMKTNPPSLRLLATFSRVLLGSYKCSRI